MLSLHQKKQRWEKRTIACWKRKFTGLIDTEAGAGSFKGIDGHTYQGQIERDMAHGLGVLVSPNGDVHSGHFVDGLPSGLGEHCNVNATVYYRGRFLDGYPHTYGEYRSTDSSLYQGEFDKGKGRHGKIRHTCPSGYVTDSIWVRNNNTNATCDARNVVILANKGEGVCSDIT